MDLTTRTHSDSIVVDATPEQVYAVVSDVTRTGEWSPICQECWWDEGAGPVEGAFFTGRNVTPERTWETRSQVTAAEPGRRFAWSVGPGRVEWAYELAPADGSATTLTETWEFHAATQEMLVGRDGGQAGAELIEQRTRWAQEGIPVTLAALKKIVEAG